MSGAFLLNTSFGCVPDGDNHVAAHSFSSVRILLPDDAGEFTVEGVPLYMPCGVGMSQLGWRNGFIFK